MSTKRDDNALVAKILTFFLVTCIALLPFQPSKEAETQVAATPTPKPSVSASAEASFPNLKPKPADKDWFEGKKILSPTELSYLLYQAGFRGKEHRLAWIVATGESTRRPKSFNGSCCHGLFQINMSGALKADRLKRYKLKSVADLYNPLVNSRVAFKMSRKGTNWSAWTVNPYNRLAVDYPGIVTQLPE